MKFEFDTDITTGDPAGTGIFDVMMQSVKQHLLQEYDSRRIRDEDYATVYLGALQSSMQQAIQYKIGMEQADVARLLAEINIEKTQAELLLIAQKTITERGQVETVETGLIGLQQDLQAKELLKADEDIALMAQKVISEKGQTEDMAFGLIGEQQDLVHEQAAKVVADKALVNQKTATEVAQTAEHTTGIVGAQQAQIKAETAHIGKKEDLIDQDILVKKQHVLSAIQDVLASIENVKLITAKVQTEDANTDSTTTGIAGATRLKIIAESGLIGKQEDLLDEEILIAQEKVDIMKEELNIAKQKLELAKEELKKMNAEVQLMGAKALTEYAQTSGVGNVSIGTDGKVNVSASDGGVTISEGTLSINPHGIVGGLMGSAIAKATGESVLMTFKGDTEKANTQGGVSFDSAGEAAAGNLGGLVGAQIQKIGSEKLLIDERAVSEKGQTATPAGGILAAQESLYKAQTNSFTWNANAALAKIAGDAFAVQKSADPEFNALGTGFGNGDLNQIMTNARSSIKDGDASDPAPTVP